MVNGGCLVLVDIVRRILAGGAESFVFICILFYDSTLQEYRPTLLLLNLAQELIHLPALHLPILNLVRVHLQHMPVLILLLQLLIQSQINLIIDLALSGSALFLFILPLLLHSLADALASLEGLNQRVPLLILQLHDLAQDADAFVIEVIIQNILSDLLN